MRNALRNDWPQTTLFAVSLVLVRQRALTGGVVGGRISGVLLIVPYMTICGSIGGMVLTRSFRHFDCGTGFGKVAQGGEWEQSAGVGSPAVNGRLWARLWDDCFVLHPFESRT